MTYTEVAQMVDSFGVPSCYYQFTNDTKVAPPFVSYYYDRSEDVFADNNNYCKINGLIIELYTDNKDFSLEETIENTLKKNDLAFTRVENYLDSERMYMVVFTTSVIITEETNNGE